MEITQEAFERVVRIVYRRGAIRPTNPFAVVSEKEIKDIILDIYDLLKYDINASKAQHLKEHPERYCVGDSMEYWEALNEITGNSKL